MKPCSRTGRKKNPLLNVSEGGSSEAVETLSLISYQVNIWMQAGLILTLCCLLFKVFIVRKQTKRRVGAVALHKDQTDVSETSLNARPRRAFIASCPALPAFPASSQSRRRMEARARVHTAATLETRQQLRRA